MEQEIKFSKSDFWASLVIGEITSWLFIAIIKSLGLKIPFLFSLPIIFPILCVLGLYIAYLIAKKIAVIYQIAKFILVGGFNTLVDWGILAFLIFVFRNYFFIYPEDAFIKISLATIVYYSIYKSTSFIIAAINSYFWNKFWTFKRASTEKMGKEFLQFFIVTFIGFLFNVSIASAVFNMIKPFDGLSLDQWGIAAAVVATVFSMVWNFIGYKFIVFDDKKQLTVNS